MDIEFFFFLLDEFFLFIDLILVFLDAGEEGGLLDDLGNLLGACFLHKLGGPVGRLLGLGFRRRVCDQIEVVVALHGNFFVGPLVYFLFCEILTKFLLVLFLFDFFVVFGLDDLFLLFIFVVIPVGVHLGHGLARL